jgi:hypothetical protein
MPVLQGAFNNTYSTSIDGFEDYFLNDLYLKFDYDTGYDKVFIKINDNVVIYNMTSTSDKISYVYLSTSSNSVFPRGAKLLINYGFDNLNLSKSVSGMTKIYSLENILKSLSGPWDGAVWNAYSDTGTRAIKINNSNMITSLEELGLSNESIMYLSFKEGKTKKSINVTKPTSDSSYYTFNIEEYFDLIPSTFNFNGSNVG